MKHDPEPTRFWRSRYAVGLIVLGAVAVYFLLTEHRAHVFAALPYVLLLACPLLHPFHGHGGHGGERAHHHDRQQSSNPTAAPQPGKTGEQP